THMHYEIDNWAFNPGSIEVTNISEFKETRGVFLVEVDDATNEINARRIQDYRQRPFQRLPFNVTGIDEAAKITEGVLERVEREVRRAEPGEPAPIVEITLRGQLGFPN